METRSSSDGEDLPSDFFDDFNKEEFMEGLSVIDSWDPSDNKPSTSRSRINAEAINNVQDLRELIREDQDNKRHYDEYEDEIGPRKKYKSLDHPRSKDRSCSANRMDEYIKPGSRRDPSKTNEAIKKDKEVKVKQYLAKHLESSDNIRPPGTELDEFYDHPPEENFRYKKRSSVMRGGIIESSSRERRVSPSYRFRWESPTRRRMSPPRHRRGHWSPRRQNHNNFRYSPRRSPHGSYYNSRGNLKRFHKYSPQKHNPEFSREYRSRSPNKRFQRRSRSPRSTRDYQRSRSRSYNRHDRGEYRRSQSKSPPYKGTKDDFRYQSSSYSHPKSDMIYQTEPVPQYSRSGPEYSGNVQSYSYAQTPAYSAYNAPYVYGPPPVISVPQPVPAPIVTMLPIEQSPLAVPTMVPAPTQTISPASNLPSTLQLLDAGNKAPKDALAQLVADGKLSHEDYLKLAPNKGGNQVMDNSFKDEVLHRCYSAMSKLDSMVPPNRLIINNELFGQEIKQITPKYCSPLKRQAPPDFQFSKFNPSITVQQNKQIVDSIIATLSLEKIVGITKRKVKKDSKDAAVQTSKPFCDMCVIRESTKFCDVGTTIDREQLTSTVHTQVVDQDLVGSKSVFNPSGSVMDGATISIAHMTPAQLVSQLAARAKTLKQAEPQNSSQYRRINYDQDGRGRYQNSYNYRY